ncbi:MAG TPA: hypothetical protein V6D28_30425 [Leptolyngbyaceae cyanobacterium]
MGLASEMKTRDAVSSNLCISTIYRQSLQPYVEPEVLEVADRKPETQALATCQPKLAAKKQVCPHILFTIVVVILCTLGSFHQPKEGVVKPVSTLQTTNVTSK